MNAGRELIADGAVSLHPDAARCHFAVAPAAVHFGDMTTAKEALGKAFRLDMRMREPALDDLRLAMFWRTIGG